MQSQLIVLSGSPESLTGTAVAGCRWDDETAVLGGTIARLLEA